MVSTEADRHLHIRAAGADGEGLWRISLEAVDGWALGTAGEQIRDAVTGRDE